MKRFPRLSLAVATAFSLATLATVYPAIAAPPEPPPTAQPALSDTAARIDVILDAPLFRHAIVGVAARSLDDGRNVYEHNADISLMPASNLKLLTASAALRVLGADFAYRTTLQGGNVTGDGTLSGDLILRGDGDPSLTSERLRDMVRALKAKGVKKFSGRVVTDTTRFGDGVMGDGWSWDDEMYYYQPQISALCLDENVIDIMVAPGEKIGDPTRVTLKPLTTYVPVVNLARTGEKGSKDTVEWRRPRARNEFHLSGSIAVGDKPHTESLTMEDPARYAATRLWEIMVEEGIEVPRPNQRLILVEVPPPVLSSTRTVLAETRSKPLSALLGEFLKPSDNLYGECLLRTIGAKTNARGTATNGAAAIRAFLKSPGVEVSDAGLNIVDGSGLSRLDNLTARFLMELLTAVDRSFTEPQKKIFAEALPLAGVDGTLRNRFKGTPGEKNVRGKTGSLSSVSSLSGYVTTRAGERVAFAILMNNYGTGGTTAQARAAQEAIVLALIDTPKPAGATK